MVANRTNHSAHIPARNSVRDETKLADHTYAVLQGTHLWDALQTFRQKAKNLIDAETTAPSPST